MLTQTHNPHLYVLLIFNGMYLFIPQDDIKSVEIIADIRVTRTSVGAVGWFGHGQDLPVFCLSGELTLLPELPEKREYFILLKPVQCTIQTNKEVTKTTVGPLGITCDEVETINLKKEHIQLQPIPELMHTATSPISQLVIYQHKIGCVGTGTSLTEFLLKLSDNYATMEREIDLIRPFTSRPFSTPGNLTRG